MLPRETAIVPHRFSTIPAIALAAGLAILGAAPQAAAGPPPAPATAGRWVERDTNLNFDIRPGAKPDQLVLMIPKDVAFPGSHEFVLARRGDGGFASEERGRPKVLLAFQSADKASLKVRGQGSTERGTWISINDYLLVRR
ncbi:MAG: hypothetical protein JWP49_2039 [Phenylobacterium sp.]|jgi:hypothetical protein|nr:hypothetical protein [Phenylobacterium sp.]